VKEERLFQGYFMFLFLFLTLIYSFGFGFFQEKEQNKKITQAKRYLVSMVGSKIKIDGNLEEPAWEKATKIDLFYEWTPGDNVPPPVDTICYVTFDKSHLYVAFRCLDPHPEKIRAHLMDRDAIDTFIQDDHVDFQIDPFNDERRGFQFRINPLGVQADAIFSELEGYEDFSWDAIWKSAGKITDFGYVVEVAIPFNQLRFPKTEKEQTWGFSAERSYPRNVRHRMTSHVRDRNSSCIICQHNKLTGFKGMSPGKNLEFDPTVTVDRTDRITDYPEGNMESGKVKIEPGITARWGITPNLMLNATINPDFSNVEADVAQLEVNTRFALRYPEKRPFFLEGADFFLTPMEAVFTRTVFDPLWGAKTTGKMGKNALGFFVTQDRYNNLLFPSNQGSVSHSIKDNVFGGVLRYRRDVGKGSTVGMLYTGRVGDDYFNHVAGVDGFFRFSRTKTLTFQYLHSQTEYSSELGQAFNQKGNGFGGDAIFAEFFHIGRDWIYGVNYGDLSPDFRADFGFIPRVDTRSLSGFLQRVIWGNPKKWFNRISLGLNGTFVADYNNDLTDQEISVSLNYQGAWQTTVLPRLNFIKELYNDITYNKTQFQTFLEMKPVGGLKYSLFARIGDSIDYSNARLASSILLNPALEVSLGKHLNINVNHIFERLSLEGAKIYIANLFQTKLIYNFNVKSFVRAIVQYTNIDRNVDLYVFTVEPKTKGLFTQFLFSYKLNPQTVLFVGYSDNHLGQKGIDLTRTDRTFFLKIGYALVM
jgi:hypothetical protein